MRRLKARQKARREFENAARIFNDVLDRETRGEAGVQDVETALIMLIDAGDRMERARQRRKLFNRD